MSAFDKAWNLLKNDEWRDIPRLPEATSDGVTVTCPMCESSAMHMMVPEGGTVLICECGVYHTMQQEKRMMSPVFKMWYNQGEIYSGEEYGGL